MQHLGLIYPEVTRLLGDDMGLVTQEYTRSLGELEFVDLSGVDLGLVTQEYTRSLGATDPEKTSGWIWFWTIASVAGMGSGAYHGYRRNDSVGWAIGWALLGGLFPVVTIPVSIAQGFGKPKSKARRRR